MSVISNVKVYGLEESIKRAKYPMSTDINKLNSDLTNGIKSLSINFMTLKMIIEFDENIDEKNILKEIEKTCKRIDSDFEFL